MRRAALGVAATGVTWGALLLALNLAGADVELILPQMLIQAPLVIVPLLVGLRTTLRIDETGIELTGGRGPRRSWAWADLLEVNVPRQVSFGPFLVHVRPRGSTWDVPGPQSPAPVQLPFVPRRRRVEAREVLRQLSARHGVPCTDSMDGASSAPPGSRLRKDGA